MVVKNETEDGAGNHTRLSNKLRRCFLIFSTSLAIFMVTLALFSPRYAYWRGFSSEANSLGPEVDRARDLRSQLEYPFARIKNSSNQVMQWRILFPTIGYLLNLPEKVFFSLCHVGCLLNLMLILHIGFREFKHRRNAILLTALTATTSWFFVSTGWLGYFDSWYLMGLILISFFRSRAIIPICCLLLPMVNERFIIGLPLAMTIRADRLNYLNKENYKQFLTDIAVGALFIVPFVIVRLTFKQANDEVSGWLLQRFLSLNFLRQIPLQYLKGAWFGFGSCWFWLVMYLAFSVSRTSKLKSAFTIFVFLFTFYVTLFLTGDLSRSMASLLPAVIYGALLFVRKRKPEQRQLSFVLALLLAINVVLPSKHIVSTFDIPIRALPHAWHEYNNLPPDINPIFHTRKANALLKQGKFKEALASMNWAIMLDPKKPKLYFYRGQLFQSTNVPKRAIADLYKARELAPKGWPLKKELDKSCQALEDRLGRKRTPPR
jgi:tetratricopeptide (TPR) repeat protein